MSCGQKLKRCSLSPHHSAFAAAVSQLFSPLSRGDTLHILPSGILNHPERLLSWLNQQDNTALYCVPTIWHELLDYAQSHNIESQLPKPSSLSGEAVADDLKQRTFHTIDNVRLFNLYGPTETVANCTYSELSAKEERAPWSGNKRKPSLFTR